MQSNRCITQTSAEASSKKPLLVLTGQYQNGKSTFLNCLLGGSYAVEGNGRVTTRYLTRYTFSDVQEAQVLYSDGRLETLNYVSAQSTISDLSKDVLLKIGVYSPVLENMDILDCPGIGMEETDNHLADQAVEAADFIVHIVQKDLDSEKDIPFLKKLVKKEKRFTVLLNCQNEALPSLSAEHSRNIEAKIKNNNLSSNYVALSETLPVYPVNLLFAKASLGCFGEKEQEKYWKKALSYLDNDELSREMVLNRSNFLPMRRLLNSFVCTFFRYTPSSSLDTISKLSEQWTSALCSALK